VKSAIPPLERTRTELNKIGQFDLTREMFDLPAGLVYLDGNSLGPLPKSAVAAATRVLADEWGRELIRGWNSAGWFTQPARAGARIAKLIGAEEGTVVLGDTLSVKVYQALASALDMNPGRKIILSDSGNFPSDLYMAQGLIASLDKGHELKIVSPERVEDHVSADVAVLMLTEVDYRTGRLHDMARLTAKAHEHGALTIWDLAHSAGALPVDLSGAGADFAVGCTYKYLNGGPGAPAFIYVSPRHFERARPALSGWLGHREPFAFSPDYKAADGIERMRVGTPPVIALAVLEAALDIWEGVDMQALRARSIELSEMFIADVERSCPMLTLASPRDPEQRGSQVSFAFGNGYAAMQAVIARGVIGDFRAPDIMRFGICPLYNSEDDMRKAAAIIAEIMRGGAWKQPEFSERRAVT
jgi:kynureninase